MVLVEKQSMKGELQHDSHHIIRKHHATADLN